MNTSAGNGDDCRIRPRVAAVLSLIFPGMGQVYNGDYGRAFMMFFAWILAFASLTLKVGYVLLPGVYLWSSYNAYKISRLIHCDSD